MKKEVSVIMALTVLLVLGIVTAGVYVCRQWGGPTEVKREVGGIGGQKDDHGCLVAAGYSWCEAKVKCLRNWEESCTEVVTPTASDVEAIRQAFVEKYQKSANEVQIEIQKFDGQYARGGVKFATLEGFGEGGIFLAYKKDGVWQLAFDGNGMFSCSEMSQYNFPAEMTLGCYDENTGAVEPGSQLANPASTNCVNKGGQLEMRINEEGGQYGICKLPDGSECEEWSLFRGECE